MEESMKESGKMINGMEEVIGLLTRRNNGIWEWR